MQKARHKMSAHAERVAEWGGRLLELDANVLRFRLAASRLRPTKATLEALAKRVRDVLIDEAGALAALEAEAARQHEQEARALRYSQYLDVLALHLRAASGGSIGAERLAISDPEVRVALTTAGHPEFAALLKAGVE